MRQRHHHAASLLLILFIDHHATAAWGAKFAGGQRSGGDRRPGRSQANRALAAHRDGPSRAAAKRFSQGRLVPSSRAEAQEIVASGGDSTFGIAQAGIGTRTRVVYLLNDSGRVRYFSAGKERDAVFAEQALSGDVAFMLVPHWEGVAPGKRIGYGNQKAAFELDAQRVLLIPHSAKRDDELLAEHHSLERLAELGLPVRQTKLGSIIIQGQRRLVAVQARYVAATRSPENLRELLSELSSDELRSAVKQLDDFERQLAQLHVVIDDLQIAVDHDGIGIVDPLAVSVQGPDTVKAHLNQATIARWRKKLVGELQRRPPSGS
jgi:hypothetical protein